MTVKNVGRRTAHNIRVAVTSDDENIILLNEYSAPYLLGLARTKEADFSFDMQALPDGARRTAHHDCHDLLRKFEQRCIHGNRGVSCDRRSTDFVLAR